MPPPPRPDARSRPLGRAASNERTSPHFLRENRASCTTAKRGEEGESSQSRNKWNKGQSVRPLKETMPSAPQYERASSAHGPTSKLSMLPVQLAFEQSLKSLEAVQMGLVRSESVTMPAEECGQCSSSEDEEEKRIHAEASIEKRGFRSAKSLERSIVKRRKLRY